MKVISDTESGPILEEDPVVAEAERIAAEEYFGSLTKAGKILITETRAEEPRVSVSFPPRLLPAVRGALRDHARFRARRAAVRAPRIAPGNANLDAIRAAEIDEALAIVEAAIAAHADEGEPR